MSIKALKRALEALQVARDQLVDPEYAPIGWSVSRLDEVIEVTKQALAAPAQEPVAWAVVGEGEWGKWVIGNQFETGNSPNHNYWGNRGYELAPLYTHPPAAQRKPLTHDEDNAICEANCNAEADAYFKARPQLDTTENRRIFYAGHRRAWLSYPCLAEAAHGIKENT